MKKKHLIILIVIGALLLVGLGFKYYPLLRAEKFTGIITAEQISCVVADGGESITVDDKELTLDPGFVANRGAVGSVDSSLWACNDFDHNDIEEDAFGFPKEGAPNGAERLVGTHVEVYAQKIGQNEYTLEGSELFYIKPSS